MEGTVKWYNFKKGYGFIKGDDDQEYFIHYTALDKGVFLRENDKVSFDAADTDKGKQAQNVKLVQKASEMGGEGAPAEEGAAEEAPAEGAAPEEPAAEEAKEEAPAEEPKEPLE
jgi:CspA family cold shock protein